MIKIILICLLILIILIGYRRIYKTKFHPTYAQCLPGSNQLSPEIDKFLQELEKYNLRYEMLNVSREDGILLRMFIEMINVKNALEIGTSNGYSTIWICLGLKTSGGHLTTIEIDSKKVKMARENLEKAGISQQVTALEGDAFKIIPELNGAFDFVFLDAGKSDYYDFFKIFYPKVKKGGIIAAHNAISYANAMKDYLDAVSNHPDLETVIVSTGSDGISISYKRK